MEITCPEAALAGPLRLLWSCARKWLLPCRQRACGRTSVPHTSSAGSQPAKSGKQFYWLLIFNCITSGNLSDTFQSVGSCVYLCCLPAWTCCSGRFFHWRQNLSVDIFPSSPSNSALRCSICSPSRKVTLGSFPSNTGLFCPSVYLWTDTVQGLPCRPQPQAG